MPAQAYKKSQKDILTFQQSLPALSYDLMREQEVIVEK
jgi:hypothetical protein